MNQLPAKNSYKSTTNIDNETAGFIREQLMPLRNDMDKAK